MSQSEAGPPRRRRKYATRACNTCRRRKSKCDGIQPVCQPCTTSGHECSWSAEAEEGSRPATRQYIEGLRGKIQMLEYEIAQLKQNTQQAGLPSTSGTPLVHDTNLSLAMMSGSMSPSENLSYVSTPNMQANLPLNQNIHLPHPAPCPDSAIQLLQDNQIQITRYQSTPDATISGPYNAPPPPIYQYIFNIDTSIALEEQSPENRLSLLCQWDHYLPELDAIQLSRHAHDTLLSRCFNYGAAWLLGLLPDLFLKDILEFLKPNSTCVPGQLQHYSPLLHCSLLAFALPLSDDSNLRAKDTRARFATHGKQWLDEEFGYSNPSLIVSLILLSDYHLGVGEMNTGYMYLGMGMRAVQSRSEVASPVRDWYHWSAFIQEKLMALDMRRPNEMPVPHIPITLPIAVSLSGRSAAGDSVEDMFAHADYTGISAHCFMQIVELTLISSAIPDTLKGTSAPIDIHLQLDGWFNSLPDALLIRQRATLTQPPILAMHIRYWWSILDLYLPFIHSSDHGMGQSLKMCNRAAEKLVKLFVAYDTQFGYQYFPRNLLKAMYTCGRALLFERSQFSEKPKRRAIAQDGIETCLKGLRILGETWSQGKSLMKDMETLLAAS